MFDKICMTEHLNIKNSAVNISKINLAFSSFSKYCILLGKRAFLLRYNAEDDYILLTNPSALFCMCMETRANSELRIFQELLVLSIVYIFKYHVYFWIVATSELFKWSV